MPYHTYTYVICIIDIRGLCIICIDVIICVYIYDTYIYDIDLYLCVCIYIDRSILYR